MNIGVWNPRAGLNAAGGTETFLRNICSELADYSDVSLTLYTDIDENTPQTLSDVSMQRVPTLRKEHTLNRLLSLTPILDSEIESLSSYGRGRLTQLFREMDHDLLTTHYYLDALLLSRAVDVPTVFRLPGIKHPSVRWKALFRYSDVDDYVANSPTTVQRARKWFDRELSGPIYAGVDCDRFEPADKTVENRILYVGRLGQGKGLKRLLNAATKLPNYTIRIVGDGPLQSELHSFAPDNVEFVGTVPHSEVHKEYQKASCFVLPSVHEGFPVVVIEALATGTPVVATRLDSTEIQVADGKTGLLLDDREPATIASAIETVVSDNSYQNRARTQGRETALEYEWSEQAQRFKEVLQDVSG